MPSRVPSPRSPWYHRPVGFVVVGLTGGIGSGKSTVARHFAGELGVPVVDADQVAREVVEPGTPGLAAVLEALGDDLVDADGRLDRAALGQRVFADPAKRKTLESILHPRIAARSMERFAALAAEGHAYVLYEAALLVETKRHDTFAALVVVAVDPDTQLARVMGRDELSKEEAQARIDAQLPLSEKVAVADYVIDNSGTLEQTQARVREVHEALLARFGDES